MQSKLAQQNRETKTTFASAFNREQNTAALDFEKVWEVEKFDALRIGSMNKAAWGVERRKRRRRRRRRRRASLWKEDESKFDERLGGKGKKIDCESDERPGFFLRDKKEKRRNITTSFITKCRMGVKGKNVNVSTVIREELEGKKDSFHWLTMKISPILGGCSEVLRKKNWET